MKRISREMLEKYPPDYIRRVLEVATAEDGDILAVTEADFSSIHRAIRRNDTHYPPLAEMAKSALVSSVKWAASGFSMAEEPVISARFDTCKLCPDWDAKALNGTGRCRICGCSTWAKLRMAHEHCPVEKW
jgi:hypothetical protein